MNLQRSHLDEAVSLNCPVIDIGDLFCAMQGKFDKRSSKSCVRPEHMDGNYLDVICEWAAEFLEPYAHQFAVIASGNHEEAIRQKHEISLIDRLVAILNMKTGSQIHHGGFGGFVRFQFQGTGKDKYQQSILLHYDHGYGGGGPVTKGVIQSNRRAVYLPDPQIVVSGHVHEDWRLIIERLRLSEAGKTYLDSQMHLVTPTYKEEYVDGHGGWHARRGAPPKPIGAYWLVFKYSRRLERVIFDAERAQ